MGGALSPIWAAVDATAGRVLKLSGGGVDVGAEKVIRCTLSILVSLPTWTSVAELAGSRVTGLPRFPMYPMVPSLEATMDMTSLPIAGVSEFGEAGFATFSSKKPTQV